jgi:hypothetical protein
MYLSCTKRVSSYLTQSAAIRETNQLLLHRDMFYCKNHIEHIHTQYVQNAELLVLNLVVCPLTTRLMYRSDQTHMTSQVLSSQRKGINRYKTGVSEFGHYSGCTL